MTPRATSLNISDTVAAMLTEIIDVQRMTKTAALEAAVEAYHAQIMIEPSLVLGYIQFDRTGDTAPAETICRECGQSCEIGGLWLRVGLTHEQISFAGPFCSRCASSQ